MIRTHFINPQKGSNQTRYINATRDSQLCSTKTLQNNTIRFTQLTPKQLRDQLLYSAKRSVNVWTSKRMYEWTLAL